MIHISILVLENSVMQAVADPHYLFSAANQFLSAAGKEPIFKIDLVGVRKSTKINNGCYTITANQQLKDVENKKMVPWIIEKYNNGADIASLCLGAFLLAATGLLNGKKCSTHWGFRNEFNLMFPEVELIDGKIVTEEGRLYSSGGALSYWNLLLYLLEKYTDRDTAILASKYFAVDIDRESQSAFAMFQGQRNHKDEAVKKTQDFIEKNVDEKISIDELADYVAMGRRSFERRFKTATQNSVLEYINRVKIESAKRSFENSRKNINEVMYDVGYTDTKAFRTIFKKITGLNPLEYRNKYNKIAL